MQFKKFVIFFFGVFCFVSHNSFIVSELLNLNENEKNNDDDNDNEEKPKEEKKKNQIKKQKSNPKNIKKQIEKDDEQKKNNNDNESDNDSDNSDDNSDDDDDDESEEVVKDSFFLKPIIRKSETTKLSPSDTKKTKTKQNKKNKNSVKYANLPVETRERRIVKKKRKTFEKCYFKIFYYII